MSKKRAHAAGHFEVTIDGHPSNTYIRSVEGGFARASPVEEPTGHELHKIKHTSTLEVDPISMEVGLAETSQILLWIQSSWRREWSRRDGQIVHADFDLDSTFLHEWYRALIMETTFPALDGASKEAAYLKVKIQPEQVKFGRHGGNKIHGKTNNKQKMWISSAFRLTIEGHDLGQTNKIESFTIKQGVKKHHYGAHRLPTVEPTKIEFPNLVGTMSMTAADELIAWYNTAVLSGSDEQELTTGCLEFLTPDRSQTIFKIDLKDVGIHHVEVARSDANADQIKRVKYELFVGSMDLVGSGGLGLE